MEENYLVKGTNLKDVADVIREKAGLSKGLQFPNEWCDAIELITKGTDTWDFGSCTPTSDCNYLTFKTEHLSMPENCIIYITCDIEETGYDNITFTYHKMLNSAGFQSYFTYIDGDDTSGLENATVIDGLDMGFIHFQCDDNPDFFFAGVEYTWRIYEI